MSLYTTPLLYLNMGGEMLYILQQRLRAQRIDSRKSGQVLDDIIAALLNPSILSTVFDPSPKTGVPCIRTTLESVALSSIMRLDKDSMNKLFDLMIMMVKYQLTVATGPREVVLLTLNHTDAMRDLVTDESAHECVSLIHQMIVDVYGNLTMGQVWQARNNCLKELEEYKVRVSVLLKLGLQNNDTTFNFIQPNFDEKYTKHEDMLKDIRIDGDNSNAGSFELYGNRMTLLGRNIYSSSYGEMEKPNAKKQQQSLNDYGTGAELKMLATQLGTDDSRFNEKTLFTLNLFTEANDERSNNNNNNNNDLGSIKSDNTESLTQVGMKGNEEYKKELDNVYADFFEDEVVKAGHSMDLLELLDEIE